MSDLILLIMPGPIQRKLLWSACLGLSGNALTARAPSRCSAYVPTRRCKGGSRNWPTNAAKEGSLQRSATIGFTLTHWLTDEPEPEKPECQAAKVTSTGTSFYERTSRTLSELALDRCEFVWSDLDGTPHQSAVAYGRGICSVGSRGLPYWLLRPI